MRFKLGDAVRVRPDAANMDLLEPWADLTGYVAAIHPEEDRVTVLFPDPFPGFMPPLAASDFRPDVPLDAAPF